MKTIIHSIWALKTDLGEINNVFRISKQPKITRNIQA